MDLKLGTQWIRNVDTGDDVSSFSFVSASLMNKKYKLGYAYLVLNMHWHTNNILLKGLKIEGKWVWHLGVILYHK